MLTNLLEERNWHLITYFIFQGMQSTQMWRRRTSNIDINKQTLSAHVLCRSVMFYILMMRTVAGPVLWGITGGWWCRSVSSRPGCTVLYCTVLFCTVYCRLNDDTGMTWHSKQSFISKYLPVTSRPRGWLDCGFTTFIFGNVWSLRIFPCRRRGSVWRCSASCSN